MPKKYTVSLSQVIQAMEFLSEQSTLYEVVPGPDFRLEAFNSSAIFDGVGSKELKGRLISELVPPRYYDAVLLPRLKAVVENQTTLRESLPEPFEGNGSERDVLVTPVVEDGRCTHIWVITKRRHSERDLQQLIFHDTVTGTPNRRHFMYRLSQTLKRAGSSKQIGLGMLLLDCDDFKSINDAYGHPVGDAFLKAFADRVRSCVRGTDVVARYGGDEFIVLLSDADEETVKVTAERILLASKEALQVGQHSLIVTTSIGALFTRDLRLDPDELIALCDKALYRAKAKGRDACVLDTAAP